MRSFGMIRISVNDPRSLGLWRIKGTDESALGKNLSVPLMRHDPSDLGSLTEIRIIPKERTLSVAQSILRENDTLFQTSQAKCKPHFTPKRPESHGGTSPYGQLTRIPPGIVLSSDQCVEMFYPFEHA